MSLAWLALNSVRGLGPARIKTLLDAYGSPEEVFRASPSAIARLDGIPSDAATQLQDAELFRQAENQLALSEQLGVTILTLSHDRYPVLLREIFAPPPVIFIKGSTEIFGRHAIGIVGTRHPSEYGKSATAMLTRELVKSKVMVVSGLAAGIDTVAHQTALDNQGLTVAVFGCGIDTIYPSTNRRLAERIVAEGGALVSEFPPGTPPEAYNFPRRNRIISGLSAGVVVVESAAKGGALITAHYALQQGREVFAVPGSIFSDRSAGTHALIRNGAQPVRSAREILDAIAVVTNPRIVDTVSPTVSRMSLELLSQSERDVFGALSDAPARIDSLTEKTGKAASELFGVLLNLELKGLARQVAGQQFVKALA